MDGESKDGRLRSFLVGGLLGASAVLAAARRKRHRSPREAPTGLSAFESAPCFEETLEREAQSARGTNAALGSKQAR